ERLDIPVESPKSQKKWPKPFAIPFDVPFKNATQSLSGVTSDTTFTAFLEAAAARMETRISLLLNIAYIPSYRPKTPKPIPKLLEDTESWEALKDDVAEYISGSKAKNKGRGVVKPFVMMIIDTSLTGESDNRKVSMILGHCKLTMADCIASKGVKEARCRDH
ncbi:hypothetical protein M405DRAFT_754395, partial [Rhizopogon salebrosus TDB-379]